MSVYADFATFPPTRSCIDTDMVKTVTQWPFSMFLGCGNMVRALERGAMWLHTCAMPAIAPPITLSAHGVSANSARPVETLTA